MKKNLSKRAKSYTKRGRVIVPVAKKECKGIEDCDTEDCKDECKEEKPKSKVKKIKSKKK